MQRHLDRTWNRWFTRLPLLPKTELYCISARRCTCMVFGLFGYCSG